MKRQIVAHTLKGRLSLKEVSKKIYTFPSLKNIVRILRKNSRNQNSEDYENLLNFIGDGSQVSEENACTLVEAALDNIDLLNHELSRFVESVLRIKWMCFKPTTVITFQKFIVNLLSAHNYHTRCTIKSLISCFVTDIPEMVDGVPNSVELKKLENVHFVINQLFQVTPLCKDIFLECLSSQFPYFKKSASCLEIYVNNLLLILLYAPELRPSILQLIFSKLIVMDVNAPKSSIQEAEEADSEQHAFKMDVDENHGMIHPIARSLDFCLDKIFHYCTITSHDLERKEFDWEKVKSLYKDLILVFDRLILPTYHIHHVQFVMFLVCSFKTLIAEAFIKHLWKKVCTPSTSPVIRQTAVTYIASLVVRGSFITVDILKGVLQEMANWIHSYILEQDGLESIDSNIQLHIVFYSICQALFYIIAFRHTELGSTKQNLLFLESLNLLKIVTCRLNPLRACQSSVARTFAAVARNYQIVYCYTIIEHNERNFLPTVHRTKHGLFEVSNNVLDGFFPFDPYVLKRSQRQIKPLYLSYKTKIEDALSKRSIEDVGESDDFLMY